LQASYYFAVVVVMSYLLIIINWIALGKLLAIKGLLRETQVLHPILCYGSAEIIKVFKTLFKKSA